MKISLASIIGGALLLASSDSAVRAEECVETYQYTRWVAEGAYKFEWLDRDGNVIGVSSSDMSDFWETEFVWKEPKTGRWLALSKKGAPFPDKSAPRITYYTGANCEEGTRQIHGEYEFQGMIFSAAWLADPDCIRHPIVVQGDLYWGFHEKGGRSLEESHHEVSARSMRLFGGKCSSTGAPGMVPKGRLLPVEEKIVPPPGPYTSRPIQKES